MTPRRSRSGSGTRRREGRGDGRDARSDTHRDGHHVVDHERGGRDQPGQQPEVLPADDVGPSAVRVGVDGLLVRQRDDHQQHDDRDRDGESESRRGGPGQHEGEQDLLGRICGGRDGVGGEDRERELLGEPLLQLLGRGDRPSQKKPLHRWTRTHVPPSERRPENNGPNSSPVPGLGQVPTEKAARRTPVRRAADDSSRARRPSGPRRLTSWSS